MAFLPPSLLSLPCLLTLIFLSLPFLLKFLLHLKPQNKACSAKLPPSPRTLPIVGNLHQLGKIPHYSLWKLSQRYGPVMWLRLGQVPTLVVSSPDTAKEVLRTHDLDCCSRTSSPGQKRLSYNSLDLAFSPYSEYWREMRKLCVIELFTAKRVQSYWRVREKEVANMIQAISNASPSPVELSETIFNLTNSVICRIAFGTMHQADQFQDYKIKGIVDDAMNLISAFSGADFFPSFGWVIDELTGFNRKLERCFRNLDSFFQKVIDEHLDPARPKPTHEDITDVMLGLSKDRTTVIHLTRSHMKAILLDVFLGSVDTSSVTVVWAMTELMRSPRVMKKVQAEIRGCIGRKARVEESELGKLKYLRMVAKETLRLHPPASLLIPRETMKQIRIGGYDIPPKTRVLVNAWAIGRDPKVWDKADEFCPERFEDSEIDFKGQHFQYLPFGSGRRMCPGMTMGITTLSFTLANLLHCFDWELPSGMKIRDLNMEEEFGLNTRKKTPLYLVPVKYNWEEYAC